MTRAGDLLRQLRVDKGYGHSRPAFVTHFGIRWGEHTQRFLEVGRTLMREDTHLSHLIEVGLVKLEGPLHQKFRAAIECDRSHAHQKSDPAIAGFPSQPAPVWTRHGDETEEEMLVREVFEALQLDGFFDPPSMELLRSIMSLSSSTSADVPRRDRHPGGWQIMPKLADTAMGVSESYSSECPDAPVIPLKRSPAAEVLL
jgi:hypothetical protein